MKYFPVTATLTLILATFVGILLVEQPTTEPAVDSVNLVKQTLSTPAVAQPLTQIPDFSAYRDTRQKKQAFFEFMLPLIRQANAQVNIERTYLLALSQKLYSGLSLDADELTGFEQLAKRYQYSMPSRVEFWHAADLLEQIDFVPASLILAQSANESGWGTSRFAREANNFFGTWCFSRGCGITPKHRTPGMAHEVARYDSVQAGVIAYVHNINTHRAYRELRIIRAEQRQAQNKTVGLQLAEGLIRYSERGADYVREIQSMIRVNNLHQYTLSTSA